MWTGITLAETIDACTTAAGWGVDDVGRVVVVVVHLHLWDAPVPRFSDLSQVISTGRDVCLLVPAALARSGTALEAPVDRQDLRFFLRIRVDVGFTDRHVEWVAGATATPAGEIELFLTLSDRLFAVKVLERTLRLTAETFLEPSTTSLSYFDLRTRLELVLEKISSTVHSFAHCLFVYMVFWLVVFSWF